MVVVTTIMAWVVVIAWPSTSMYDFSRSARGYGACAVGTSRIRDVLTLAGLGIRLKHLGIHLKHLGSAHLPPSEKIHNCLLQNHVLMTWRGLLRLRGSGQSADAEMSTDTGEDTMDVTRNVERRLGALTVESQIDSQVRCMGVRAHSLCVVRKFVCQRS
jgi:hypothetical protein